MQLDTLRLDPHGSIVVLTGAGVSAESGLETFRGAGGLWCGHRVEDVATPEAFQRNPAMVHDFYNMRRRGVQDPSVQPNAAHHALATLEKNWQGDFLLVTQNIDDLHERAGSQKLLHMHGEVMRAFCALCDQRADMRVDMTVNTLCDGCGRDAGMRPDIVWFGEMPYHMDHIEQALQNCDLFLSIGTSGHVYPAAGFVRMALFSGAHTITCNLDPAINHDDFHTHLIGPAGTTIPSLVQHFLQQK